MFSSLPDTCASQGSFQTERKCLYCGIFLGNTQKKLPEHQYQQFIFKLSEVEIKNNPGYDTKGLNLNSVAFRRFVKTVTMHFYVPVSSHCRLKQFYLCSLI